MTPKQFFGTGCGPFPCTRLDEFSGVEHRQMLTAWLEKGERVDKLPDSIFGNVKAKAEAGAQRMAEEEFGEAYELLVDAIGLPAGAEGSVERYGLVPRCPRRERSAILGFTYALGRSISSSMTRNGRPTSPSVHIWAEDEKSSKDVAVNETAA
jgi:hypothetical protein